jgi:hypothetical protein
MGTPIHGHARRGKKTRIYTLWRNIMQRCHDSKHPHWKNYGGRGIAVCERWHSFENFVADVGETIPDGLTFDRTDNERGYGPDNWRWATRAQQSDNRRRLAHEKLTDEQRAEIALASGTYRQIAIAYGISPQYAHRLKRRLSPCSDWRT